MSVSASVTAAMSRVSESEAKNAEYREQLLVLCRTAGVDTTRVDPTLVAQTVELLGQRMHQLRRVAERAEAEAMRAQAENDELRAVIVAQAKAIHEI